MNYLFEDFYKFYQYRHKRKCTRAMAQISTKKELVKSYLRGLFDTDGSLYFRRKSEKIVSIISRDPQFLKEVKFALGGLNYSPSVSGKNLYLYQQREINRFFSEIKPANTKHTQKYANSIGL